MGLDASVMCNCFREGRTTEPPMPRDWLEIDQEGYLNPRPEHDSDDVVSAFDAWEDKCCAHPGMRQAVEWIATWSGVSLFKQALEQVGRRRFPVLLAELPKVNGGQTLPDRSALALKELDDFAALDRTVFNTCLVDTATGEVLRTYEGRTAIPGRAIPWPDGRLQDDQGRVRCDYPAGLHVEDRPQAPADFAGIVEALRVVFRASVETGNPVRWC